MTTRCPRSRYRSEGNGNDDDDDRRGGCSYLTRSSHDVDEDLDLELDQVDVFG